MIIHYRRASYLFNKFNFCNVQPTSMLGRIMKYDFFKNFICFVTLKRLIKGFSKMCIQVIYYQMYFSGLIVFTLYQFLNKVCKIFFGTPRCYFDIPLIPFWFNCNKKVAYFCLKLFVYFLCLAFSNSFNCPSTTFYVLGYHFIN